MGFAPPPSPDLQPFAVQPPQYADPLQTLAQMQQMRLHGLQQQGAQQDLQLGQMKLTQAQEDLADQQKLRQVYTDWAKSGNTKLDDLMSQATAAGVGPRTLMTLQQQVLEHRSKLATTKEAEFKNLVSTQAQNTQAFNAVASAPPEGRPAAWQTERGKLIAGGFATPADIPEAYPGDQAFEELRHHHRTSVEELALEKEQREAKAAALEAAPKVRQQAVLDIRSAPVDPGTGLPTSEAWQAILAKNKGQGLDLPAQPSPQFISDLVESTVPEKDLPEYRGKLRQQAIQDIRSAPVDPATGTPTPAAWAAILRAYPKLGLPAQPTRQYIGRLVESTAPVLPKTETDLAVMANDPNRTPEERQQATNALKAMKAQKDVVNTETELARVATDPNATPEQRRAADAALKRLDVSKLASRPVTNITIPGVPTAPATGEAAQVHGEEYLKTLPPSIAARVKSIATGNEAAPTGRAAVSGAGMQLMNALYQYDPEFTPLLAQQRKETLKEFTNTGMTHAGGQKMALNTVIHHADLYLDAVAALKNGTFKPGNAIYNRVASAFGAAPPTNAALLARFFAGETGKVATGGVPAEGEINGILKNMSTDGSPEAMEGAGKTLIGIAAGRMIPLKELRDKAHLEKFVDILGPDAREILQRRGFDPETMKPVQGGGGAGATGAKKGDTKQYQGRTYEFDGTQWRRK